MKNIITVSINTEVLTNFDLRVENGERSRRIEELMKEYNATKPELDNIKDNELLAKQLAQKEAQIVAMRQQLEERKKEEDKEKPVLIIE